jgi:DNA polymerase-3 subunit epsilon
VRKAGGGQHTSGPLARWSAWLGGREQALARCVVVDTETSGLDPGADALLAIGGVAVDEGGLIVEDSFEIVLRHAAAITNDSTVVHGLGVEAQSGGAAPGEALDEFASYAGSAPFIAFHADFDRLAIRRACERAGVQAPKARWLDVAELAATLRPEEHKRGCRALDDWLACFDIDGGSRHTAPADAFATGELFLRLRAIALREGCGSFASLARLARRGRWLAG